MFSVFNLAVGVPFVDSDVIVDYHCLQLSSQNGVDPLANPRQSILLHNVLINRKRQLLYLITNRQYSQNLSSIVTETPRYCHQMIN